MKLIDADALDIFRVEEDGIHQWREIVNQMVSDIQSLAPVIDAEPVRCGRWEKSEDEFYSLFVIKCSECHEEWVFEIEEDVKRMHYNYCPNCGAKMDKED